MQRPTIRTAAEAVGIVVLVATLVFLALEIKQSNKIAIASIQYDILSDFNEYHRQVLANPEVAEFVSKFESTGDPDFSPADKARAHAFVTIFIQGQDNLITMWEQPHLYFVGVSVQIRRKLSQ